MKITMCLVLQGAEIVEFLANNPRIVSPCLDIPLASVQLEGTDQLTEISMPHRSKPNNTSSSTKNGGNRVAKTVRTPAGEKEQMGNNIHQFEENIPLTTPKNSCHAINNGNNSAYASIHHDPMKSFDGDLI